MKIIIHLQILDITRKEARTKKVNYLLLESLVGEKVENLDVDENNENDDDEDKSFHLLLDSLGGGE